MLYWLIIFLGIIIISLSISNPFFKLILNKILNINLLFIILIRILLFLFGMFIIFVGLYVESID